jgi:very-short-patch-repair endonuclease
VFVDPAVPVTPQKELAIAVAATNGIGGAWARSCAALFGMVQEHPPVPEVVVPWNRGFRIPGAHVHRSRALTRDELMYRDRIRCTNPLVAILDLGVVLSAVEVAEAIIRARQLKLFEPIAVANTIDRLSKPGRTGLTVAREAVELMMIGDRPAETVLEMRFAIGPGTLLPPYEYQHEVRIRGERFFIDFAYPAVRLAIEVDGYEKRAERRSLDYDDWRQNLITADGWSILRFTWTQVKNDPSFVAAQIIERLGALRYDLRG